MKTHAGTRNTAAQPHENIAHLDRALLFAHPLRPDPVTFSQDNMMLLDELGWWFRAMDKLAQKYSCDAISCARHAACGRQLTIAPRALRIS